jgi:hypothetical protein
VSISLSLMCLYVTDWDLILAGGPSELNWLSQIIAATHDVTLIEIDNFNRSSPSPYERFIHHIQIFATDGKVMIDVENTNLTIKGSRESLQCFSQSLLFFAKQLQDEGQAKHLHKHVEYYDEHYYLDPSSYPLIFVGPNWLI